MKTRLALALFSAAALTAPLRAEEPPASADKPEPAGARSKVLELAGAFANDGYRLRDGFWAADIEPGKSRVLAVNLFAGNEYWFSAAVVPPGRKLAVDVYNAKGKLMKGEIYEDGPAAAAGFVPSVSGEYFIKVTLVEGEKTEFCLLYSYK